MKFKNNEELKILVMDALSYNYSSIYEYLIWSQLEFMSHIDILIPSLRHTSPIFLCRTCEICHATAVNVAGEHIHEAEDTTAATTAEPVAPTRLAGQPRSWHGRSIMNVLLACMIVAFVISWLFHFNVISWLYVKICPFRFFLFPFLVSLCLYRITGRCQCHGVFMNTLNQP